MDLFTAMKLFTKVADVGSFSEVARQEYITTSSISRQINALEEELGVSLLQRTTRKVSLTEAGAMYYERVRGVLTEVEEMYNDISELQEMPKGELRLQIPVAFG